MPSVLITAVGGDVGRSIAFLMRLHFGEFRLVGCDARDFAEARAAVDDFVLAPPADSHGYVTWLRDLVRDAGISVVIPTSDAELAVLATNTDLPMISAGEMAIEIGKDKFSTSRFLSSVGIPGPWTVDFFPPPKLPCVIKPRTGQGSKNVTVCESLEQANSAWTQIGESAIAQELLLPREKEITCAVYRSGSGEIRVVQLLRRLTGGMTSWARVLHDDRILEQCQTIAHKLNVRGSINIQLMLTADGPRIFEINPRFSSTVAMRDSLGFRDFQWAVLEFFGKAIPEFVGIPTGTVVVRDSISPITKS